MKICSISLICGLWLLCAQAQAQDSSGLRISLLTCGPGTEFIGASFGHNAIRIIDSRLGSDVAYNYGTFDFDEPNFELRFARGTLPYSLSRSPYQNFLREYQHYGRGVWEQELNLTGAEKERLVTLLEENLLPQNRQYIYSSVYDNCATRVRDIVKASFSDSLKWGNATGNQKLTFRQVFNRHLTADPWQAFGINILTGTNVDKTMTNEQAMYLPEYLKNGFAGAHIGTRALTGSTTEILPQKTQLPPETPFTPPFWTILAISAITILLTLLPATQRAGLAMGSALVFISGLLGVLMLVMWAFTDHRICENNLNLLWALPTNIVVPFLRRPKEKYAMVAMFLILLVPVLHVIRVQHFPMAELSPLLAALMLRYGMIVRRAKG